MKLLDMNMKNAKSTGRNPRIIIIGAGPGGLCAAIRLRAAGFDDLRILEQSDGIGGTWWRNVYPGCRCDVPSILYSYSFTPDYVWTSRYASQPEIQAYLQHCAERFDVADRISLDTRVVGAEWDEENTQWAVDIDGGERIWCDILIGAVGLFNNPAIPDIPGLSKFAGPVMHSAEWDRTIDISDRHIAVIGSAASAVQIVPEIAPTVKHLDVYQRTPNHVRPREDDYSQEEIEYFAKNPKAVLAERQMLWDWVNNVVRFDNPDLLRMMAEECEANAASVHDPELRTKLSPDYAFGSKRGLVSSDWFPTFNRENVTLVTDPIEQVLGDGITTCGGTKRGADCIILATGFETWRFLSVIDVTGKEGLRLADHWANGAQAYLGITVPHFPNLFMLYGPNTNSGSVISQLEMQTDYIVRHIVQMVEDGQDWIEVRQDAADAFAEKVQNDLARLTVLHSGVSGYYRAPSGRIVTQSPYDMEMYRAMTSQPDDHCYIAGKANAPIIEPHPAAKDIPSEVRPI